MAYNTRKNSYRNSYNTNLAYKKYSDEYYERSCAKKQLKKIKKTKVKSKKKINILALALLVGMLSAYGYYIVPYNFKHYFKPVFLNRFLNRNIKFDINNYIHPTLEYNYNCYFDYKKILTPTQISPKNIMNMEINSEYSNIRENLINLFNTYPNVNYNIFVWEYTTSNGLQINADNIIPAGDLIEIPIIASLYNNISEINKNKKHKKFVLDEIEYNQSLQSKNNNQTSLTLGEKYKIDYLAKEALLNSDKSALNMLIYKLGGIDNFNRNMRNMGYKNTRMNDWEDSEINTNYTSVYELSKMIYNIDNPNYINTKYKKQIIQALDSNDKSIIKSSLNKDVAIISKISRKENAYGETGIVYSPSGKKYIITILTNNAPKDVLDKLIKNASLIIYNGINI